MPAGIYNFTIEQGADFKRVITWKDSAGTIINVTGYTARMQIREFEDSDTVILSLTTENSRIALGGTAGTITLTIASADTVTITQSYAVYDLELVSSGGVVTRLLQGEITIDKEVTR